MDQRDLRAVLAQLSQRPVAYYPAYAELAGSVKAGVLLSQLMYWWAAVGGRKFYKIDEEIMEETYLTEKEIRSAKVALKALSFLIITREGTPARTHYEVDETALYTELAKLDTPKGRNWYSQKGETGIAKRAKHSISETTTENTQIDAASQPQLTPGEYNQAFFEQGEAWLEDSSKTLSGDQLIEIAQWMVEEKGWNKVTARRQLIAFIDYWTTLDARGKVPRWKDPKNKYFKLKARISTWMSRATN